MLTPLSRAYKRSVQSRVNVEYTARTLPSGKCRYTVMFLQPFVQQSVDWMNQFINLQELDIDVINEGLFYSFLGVIFHCHNSSMSLEKGFNSLKRYGKSVHSLLQTRFILPQLCAYPPTGHQNYIDEGGTWECQWDYTPQLDELERKSFSLVSRVFSVPLHQIIALDDDVVGRRGRENQVKTLSARKCDKEGHLADVLADAIFNDVISVRFRRRGEGQESAAIATVELRLKQSGQLTLSSLILIAGSGYGRDILVDYLRSKGISSVMINPSHLSRVHPFIPASLLALGREDAIDEFDIGEFTDEPNSNVVCSSNDSTAMPVTGAGDPRFVIKDGGKEGLPPRHDP